MVLEKDLEKYFFLKIMFIKKLGSSQFKFEYCTLLSFEVSYEDNLKMLVWKITLSKHIFLLQNQADQSEFRMAAISMGYETLRICYRLATMIQIS